MGAKYLGRLYFLSDMNFSMSEGINVIDLFMTFISQNFGQKDVSYLLSTYFRMQILILLTNFECNKSANPITVLSQKMVKNMGSREKV